MFQAWGIIVVITLHQPKFVLIVLLLSRRELFLLTDCMLCI